MLWLQLLIGAAMITLTVIIHAAGVFGLVGWLVRRTSQTTPRPGRFELMRNLIISTLALSLFHAIEIWAWAILYVSVGEFGELSAALYFSTVTFTTLGYGDITLVERWRMLSAIEAANGIILFGVSTAVLFAVFRRWLLELMPAAAAYEGAGGSPDQD